MKEHWMSKITGEVVFTHKEAMELYRQGHETRPRSPRELHKTSPHDPTAWSVGVRNTNVNQSPQS